MRLVNLGLLIVHRRVADVVDRTVCSSARHEIQRRKVNEMPTAEQGKGAVIVTGASRGIGAAIAEQLAEDGYGVVVNYAADADGAESVVSTIRAHGGRAVAVRADVTAPDDVANLFDRAQQEMGPLAALVNNAGTTGEQARIDEQDADKLARLMQVNVVGPMVCAKHAVQAMSTAHGGTGGSIVNIASIGAQAPPGIPGFVPYEATKGAVVTFSRGLSNEVAPEGIRVNSVSPGVIDTEMAAATPGTKEAAASSPIGRVGRPNEIAAAVSWLVSPAASYVTGSDITVSGGL
jgi:NAD(P)-dependent dehydrogenase (short-subunit alcohol dehydrogenase family)